MPLAEKLVIGMTWDFEKRLLMLTSLASDLNEKDQHNRDPDGYKRVGQHINE